MEAIDLSVPSYRGAYFIARQSALAHAHAFDRQVPTIADKAAGDAVMIRLLWMVESSDGGFIGLDDAQLEALCQRKGYDLRAVHEAMWAPGEWPGARIAA